jgi:drug/metabolite transporter (DMT)-like permease
LALTINFKAIGFCLIAIMLFDLMAVQVRYLSQYFSVQELSVYRNILGVLPSILILIYNKEFTLKLENYKIPQWKLALVRGLFVAVAQYLFYTALSNLELATVSALAQTNALFVVILAVLIYKEVVKLWRWLAVVLGFLGAILIIGPGSDSFSLSGLFPVGAAFCYAVSMVTLRSFDKSTSTSILYLYSAVAAAISAIIYALITIEFSAITNYSHLMILISMSMCGGFGVVFLMVAYRSAPAALLAPFSFFGILNAYALGWLIFGEAPIDELFPGALLIIGSGLIIIWREQRSKV